MLLNNKSVFSFLVKTVNFRAKERERERARFAVIYIIYKIICNLYKNVYTSRFIKFTSYQNKCLAAAHENLLYKRETREKRHCYTDKLT